MPNHLDPLAILREEAVAAAIAHGADRCEQLADNMIERLCGRLAGVRIYIPAREKRQIQKTHDAIIAAFNGRNTGELARAHGITPRAVRKIISRRIREGGPDGPITI